MSFEGLSRIGCARREFGARALGASLSLGALLAGCPLPVRAGAQAEEPLADSVRSAMSAAVVAPQRQVQVATLAVQIVTQDHTPKTQVGLHVEQAADIPPADDTRPERHHLRVPTCAGAADRVFAKRTLDLDQSEQQGRLQSGSFAFVPDGFQKFNTANMLGVAFLESGAHLAKPAQVGQTGFDGDERRLGRRTFANGSRHGGTH